MLVVVAYDMGSNRRREEVSAMLEACGARVQLSVFECVVPSDAVLKALQERIESIIDNDEDQVRFYVLGSGSEEANIIGSRMLQERQPFWII